MHSDVPYHISEWPMKTHLFSRALPLNSSTTFWKSVTVYSAYSLSWVTHLPTNQTWARVWRKLSRWVLLGWVGHHVLRQSGVCSQPLRHGEPIITNKLCMHCVASMNERHTQGWRQAAWWGTQSQAQSATFWPNRPGRGPTDCLCGQVTINTRLYNIMVWRGIQALFTIQIQHHHSRTRSCAQLAADWTWPEWVTCIQCGEKSQSNQSSLTLE